jgi:ankyrin repeat protein
MNPNQLAYFLDACRRGDTADVEKICSLLPELINAADAKGFTPLIIAAYNNQPEVVRILLQNGADPNAGDMAGNTPLMGAAFKGYVEIARILIEQGTDINQRNGQGAAALTFAATFGQTAIARMLLEGGADTSFQDSRGKTALDHARIQENEEMIELLEGS